ncbi:hypothetical protein LZ31DRAFT_384394 [Colletotrichum somersetense]|nr:hypothetical protein LZ31DRAFT_384394 [Colletotrichum somersetense]
MVIRIAGMVVDEDIMSFFPPGSDIIDGQRYGSAWTMKGRITIREPKETKNYFIKHALTTEARESLAGEHVAMTAFHQLDPTMVGRSSKSDGARSRTELEVGRSSKSDGARSRTELEVGRSSRPRERERPSP